MTEKQFNACFIRMVSQVKEQKIKQSEIAKILNVSQSNVSKILNQKINCPPEFLINFHNLIATINPPKGLKAEL